MDAVVLDAVASETQSLVDETQSPVDHIKYQPEAFTREGRYD